MRLARDWHAIFDSFVQADLVSRPFCCSCAFKPFFQAVSSGHFQMSTAFFATPGILASLHGLFRWFTADTVPAKCAARAEMRLPPPWCQRGSDIKRIANYSNRPSGNVINGIKHVSGASGASGVSGVSSVGGTLPVLTVSPVLRVMRVLEAGQSSASVGRMVISGRMADVCAELDRLAAREAALH